MKRQRNKRAREVRRVAFISLLLGVDREQRRGVERRGRTADADAGQPRRG